MTVGPAILRTCRGCGCDDNHACLDARGRPCSWALLDIDFDTGVCSCCAEALTWHAATLAQIGLVENEALDAVRASLEYDRRASAPARLVLP